MMKNIIMFLLVFIVGFLLAGIVFAGPQYLHGYNSKLIRETKIRDENGNCIRFEPVLVSC